jgi:hypothetical protein
MLGRKELKELGLQKQTLVAESSLNRLALLQEIQNVRAAASWVGSVSRASSSLSPLLTLLTSLTSFVTARTSSRSASWIARLVKTAGLILPVYRLWKLYAARRKDAAEADEPTV